jgi:hypothetical protein
MKIFSMLHENEGERDLRKKNCFQLSLQLFRRCDGKSAKEMPFMEAVMDKH